MARKLLPEKTVQNLLRVAAVVGVLAGRTAMPLTAQDLERTVIDWEERLDACIRVVLCDTSSDCESAMRAQERFPMFSTFKSLLCGAVLARVDAGQE